MAPHSSTLAWKIPWMEEPGGLQSMGSPRVGHDWSDLAAAVAVIDIHTHTHTHTHTEEYHATIENASSITPQNKINIFCKCSVDKRTLDRKWVHLDGLEKQMKHIYAIRSLVELILRRGLASDHRVCLRPQSILLGTSWCPLSWTGCWIHRCAQLWKFIKNVLKIFAIFCMLYHKRKVNRKLKWSITVYRHSCAFSIRKVKCASWNICHWKKHILKKRKSINVLLILE